MASEQLQCQALKLSDGQKCKSEATHADGIFCWFHANQAQGLYEGYKQRNAQLDVFDDQAPPYLKNSQVTLSKETFQGIEDESVLQEVHTHLFNKYVLYSKVIDARKLHHQHFYPVQFDYGHQAYLDKLSSQRHLVLRALETLGKRFAQVLYQKEQWFDWVRKAQEEEEANREKEQKKIKQEAALFKMHMKNLDTRMELIRQKEENDRQDAFLEEAYRKRKRTTMSSESEDDEVWDPINDIEYDRRHRYIDLIKNFLWMDVLGTSGDTAPSSRSNPKADEASPAGEPESSAKKPKKKQKTKAAAASNPNVSNAGGDEDAPTGQRKLLAMEANKSTQADANQKEPDKKSIESEQEMRKRLSQGVKKNLEDNRGLQVIGTLENPIETYDKTAPMTDFEIESVINDVREIKLLLFSRLVLSQASILPTALRAGSVEEFLNDAEVTESDLRDLCLKVAEPTLQLIRDACADFARGGEADEDVQNITNDEDEDEDEDETIEDMIIAESRYSHLETHRWFRDRILDKTEKLRQQKAETRQQKAKSQPRKEKVTICGRSIWNHASEKAMSRAGWFQFSVMAKDCNLKDAIQLCRNWAEFSDLSLLTLWQYFPASNWASWGSDRLIQQLQELQFLPYFLDFDVQQHSRSHQVSGRGQGRRQHDFVETRNILIGHMKRNDPVTRRFLQYLKMRTGDLLVLVRDGKTGRVITAPPDEHLWTYRIKQGLGRASKNEWENLLEVGPVYFDKIDRLRDWRFGFNDYYDVFIWDFAPCQSAMTMYNVTITELRNAWRIAKPRDLYTHMEPLLRTLTREEDTMRTRQIQEGEDVQSIWDKVMGETTQFISYQVKGDHTSPHSVTDTSTDPSTSPYTFYNEANVAEDKVLFADELVSNNQVVPFREIRNGINRIDKGILPSTARHMAKELEALTMSDDTPSPFRFEEEDKQDRIWALPNIWESGITQLRQEQHSAQQRQLLKRTGLDKTNFLSYGQRLLSGDPMETMERDRSFAFKDSFHAGDLEPGSIKKHYEVQDKIDALLKQSNSGSTDWIWFVAEVLDWLRLRTDYNDYTKDPMAPWPHSFIVHDMVRAFSTIAMFFQGLNTTRPVTEFLNLERCNGFRNSLLFDPAQRAKTRPDRRSRTSYKYRDRKFWEDWNEFMQTERHFADVYPFDWSLAIRPIIAHLYQAGVIAPGYYEPVREVVPGIATANTEPHRPGKLDLFINYEDPCGNFSQTFPPDAEDNWPVLLPRARIFVEAFPNARFALLRLWSAPHFYPLMIGPQNRAANSFLDSAGRAWEWKFIPKDMPGSEYSIHLTVGRRLELLRTQFGDRVVNRGDLIIVMGESSEDLLKTCTAVTFAIQTKPWFREVDLWKSFINVDLNFLEQLDDFWLD